MKALDHDTFHSMEIDGLYEELDGPSAAALRDHAASCGSCAARFERLRRARQRGLAALAEAVPEDFESRIMAAVDAALARRAGGPLLIAARMPSNAPAPPQAAQGVSGKVIPFFARPSFAVAATLILVLGAAAILSQTTMARKASPMATSMDESAPAAVAASGLTPVPMAAEPVAAATATAEGAVALGGEQAGKAAQAPGDPPAARPMARVAAAPAAEPAPAAMLAAASTPAAPPRKSTAAGGSAQDPSFAAAQALYNAGRYAEALPRFEALKASNPEAALYAARCIQKTRGCAAAASRFDAVAKGNSGTAVGSRARQEADSCESKAAAGPAPAATTGPGTPGVGKPSSPKVMTDPSKDDAFR